MTLTVTEEQARADDGVVVGDGRPRRRTYSAEYKTAILAEYDALPAGAPQRGALLRREGLYSSHVAEWRKARDAAVAAGLAPKVRQPAKTPEQVEVDRLRKANARLVAELERTTTALEIVGKVHALLEQLSESADSEPPSGK